MSSSEQRVSTDVVVDVFARSVTAQVTMIMQLGLHIAKERRLSPDYILKHRSTLEAGLYAWLAQQTLLVLSYEIYNRWTSEAIERFDVRFAYTTTRDLSVRQIDRDRISAFCRALQDLPGDARYRIVVQTGADAVPVPGWSPTRLYPLKHSGRADLGSHGYGNIGGHLEYHGRI